MTGVTPITGRGVRGLGLAELLVSLAITASLLVAVSAAFSASSAAVQQNDQFSRATQAARVTLGQVVGEIRRADSVLVTGTTRVDVIRPAPSRSANEVSRTFRYDAAAKRVLLKVNYAGGLSSVEHPLADNVTAACFGPAETGTDSQGRAAVVRVPVTLTVTLGDNEVSLSGAASPRRAMR